MNKTCNTCGKVHTMLPDNAKVTAMGTWFNCDCGSTLVIQVANWKELLEAEMAE